MLFGFLYAWVSEIYSCGRRTQWHNSKGSLIDYARASPTGITSTLEFQAKIPGLASELNLGSVRRADSSPSHLQCDRFVVLT
eukprot:scaffold647_cov411-Prasinococcus_capsulatus_cf.AAC.19